MNQILEFGTEKRGKAPKGNKGNKGGGSASDKIVKVFAILLMLFAIALIASGAYSLIKNNSNETEEVDVSSATSVNATINAELDEENGQVIITVESEIAISKVVYNWNTNNQITIDGENAYTFEKSIDLPAGSNTLNIKVIDVDSNETKQAFDFDSDAGSDIINPNIEISYVGNILTILASDETALSYLTYRWNDEEETTVYPEDDETTITVDLEIPEGSNTITVVAVDTNYNSKTETQTLLGVLEPEINYELNGTILKFYCTHEDGITKIHYTLNGQEAEASFTEEDGFETPPTDVQFEVELAEGDNTISLEVTSSKDTTAVFEGTCQIGESSEDGEETEDSDDEESDSSNETEDSEE